MGNLYKKISIIGAGTWGIAIASHLCSYAKIEIFHYNNNSLRKIQEENKHPNIKNFIIPDSIVYSYSNKIDSDLCVIAVPVQNIKSVIEKYKIEETMPILILSKGIENETLNFPLNLLLDCGFKKESIAILSGPSHAEQVIVKHPTSVVVSSDNQNLSLDMQELFSNSHFRVYLNSDIIGVQIGGAVKNVISIASGIVEGLGYKENTTSALLSRGLHEIKKFGFALNAKEDTLNGLAGLGDLMATAFSGHSRNRQVGINIAKGVSAEKTIEQMNMNAEGVSTSKSLYELAKKYKIEMPICANVYEIIYNNKDPKVAIDELMNRELRSEF